jgi:hypothetical protein
LEWSSSLRDHVNDAVTYVFFPDEKKLTTTIKLLKYFRNVIEKNDNSCYSKADQRIITPSVAASRFGDGPLNYYIGRSGKQIIIAVPRDKQSEDDEEESDEDEENYKEVSILEAKEGKDAADLDATLPQLLAQMLDAFS